MTATDYPAKDTIAKMTACNAVGGNCYVLKYTNSICGGDFADKQYQVDITPTAGAPTMETQS
jgi:hypothetical protein